MQDPQSLHKYLYTHNNPVNGIDPGGLFSIIETIKVFSARLVLLNTQIGRYVEIAKPATRGLIGLWILNDLRQAVIAGLKPSALTVGINGSFPFLAKTGGIAGVDLVFGSQGHAWFGVGGISTNNNWGVNTINVGLTFNTPFSEDVEGFGRTVTLSFKLLPRNVKKWLKYRMQQTLPKLHQAFMRRSGGIGEFAGQIDPQLVQRFSNSITKMISTVLTDDSSITIIGGANSSFSISVAPGIASFGRTKNVEAGFLRYTKISTEEEIGF